MNNYVRGDGKSQKQGRVCLQASVCKKSRCYLLGFFGNIIYSNYAYSERDMITN